MPSSPLEGSGAYRQLPIRLHVLKTLDLRRQLRNLLQQAAIGPATILSGYIISRATLEAFPAASPIYSRRPNMRSLVELTPGRALR